MQSWSKVSHYHGKGFTFPWERFSFPMGMNTLRRYYHRHPSVCCQQIIIHELKDHVNSIDPNIEFTIEEPGEDGGVPFLDTYCVINDGSIDTRVYRKPTHTDLYLNWDSHHPLSAKISVVNTLFYRAEIVCSNQLALSQEHAHLREVLTINGYPPWAIQKGINLIRRRPSRQGNTDKPKKEFNGYIVVPYVHGFSEKYKRILENAGVRVYFKGVNTLKSQLVSPKDKDPKEKKANCIYGISCGEVACSAKYIGESGRTLEERIKDHTSQASSALHQHMTVTGHPIPTVMDDNIQVITTESNIAKRRIIEAMYIKVNDPSMNRNVGKSEIPDIYDNVLKTKGGLQLNDSFRHIPSRKNRRHCDSSMDLTAVSDN